MKGENEDENIVFMDAGDYVKNCELYLYEIKIFKFIFIFTLDYSKSKRKLICCKKIT